MPKTSQLRQLMAEDLPNKTFQKRLQYRTSTEEVLALFHIINKEIFNEKLPVPKFEVLPNCRAYWGLCIADGMIPDLNSATSSCTIRLKDKWFCKHWLIAILAHEMCHQYQWDVLGHQRIRKGRVPLLGHGPSFFVYRDKLMKYGIPLKKEIRISQWFKHQNMFKC